MTPGERNKFGAPYVRTLGLSEANVLFWKMYLWPCCVILAPHSDSPPGELCPLGPLVTSLVLCNKSGKFSKKKQIFKSVRHELLFHEHLQFLNTIGLPHGSCTDCQQSLLAAFQVSSVVFAISTSHTGGSLIPHISDKRAKKLFFSHQIFSHVLKLYPTDFLYVDRGRNDYYSC